MGFPIVVKQGCEYVIPFFKVSSTEKTDTMSPPFAYLRVSYPTATILTYNNLRSLPEWKDVDWNESTIKNENRATASKLNQYYRAIRSEQGTCFADQDQLLLECLNAGSPDSGKESPLIGWYQKLIAEAKKYR